MIQETLNHLLTISYEFEEKKEEVRLRFPILTENKKKTSKNTTKIFEIRFMNVPDLTISSILHTAYSWHFSILGMNVHVSVNLS